MKDHNYEGKPVATLPDEVILEIYQSRLQRCDNGQELTDEEYYWVRLRLEIEMLIRARRMRPGS